MPKTQLRKPIEIKISTVVAVAATLRESDPAVLNAAMRDITGGEPDYFDNEFTVIDVGSISPTDVSIDWAALIELFRSYRLNPIAVRNAAPGMEAAILAQGLSLDVMPAPRHAREEKAEHDSAPASIAPKAQSSAEAAALAQSPQLALPAASAPRPIGSMIIDTPVRAGQRIYAQGRDLIITAAVNNGAEVIADGSIHVYAPLRGRALAGASGDASARIYAMSMEAELVSIAGFYRTFEDGLPNSVAQRPAQIRLNGDKLDIVRIAGNSRD